MSEVKNILITTYFFYPTNNPRAFRITALAKKLASKGHKVTVITADLGFNYEQYKTENNIDIITIKTGYLLNPPKMVKHTTNQTLTISGKQSPLKSGLKTFIRKCIRYFLPAGHVFEYSISLARYLKKIEINNYDVIISNSHPFAVHLGTAIGMGKFNNISIAESGDPYYYNHYKIAPYQKWIEVWALSKFTYITIPVDNAISDYKKLNMDDKAVVIPHGFDFENVELNEVNESKKVEFAFAGRLYKDIRNPTSFLNYLVNYKSNCDFRLTIYTDFKNQETKDILSPFIEILGDKLKIYDLIPREDCIKQLSSANFLINFTNDTKNQTPSKLIDYTLTKRPFISIGTTFDNTSEFENFFNKNFSEFNAPDISRFNINNICREFEKLF
jgi:hypothetical protein